MSTPLNAGAQQPFLARLAPSSVRRFSYVSAFFCRSSLSVMQSHTASSLLLPWRCFLRSAFSHLGYLSSRLTPNVFQVQVLAKTDLAQTDSIFSSQTSHAVFSMSDSLSAQSVRFNECQIAHATSAMACFSNSQLFKLIRLGRC